MGTYCISALDPLLSVKVLIPVSQSVCQTWTITQAMFSSKVVCCVLVILLVSGHHQVEAWARSDKHGNSQSSDGMVCRPGGGAGACVERIKMSPGGDCQPDEFNCGRNCIPQSWVCDGRRDCGDNADETSFC